MKQKHTHRLIRMMSNHSNVRTDSMDGMPYRMPEVGQMFIFTGDSLTPGGNGRVIMTTPVTALGVDYFHTQNSTYKLEKLDESV